jgi:hypothetical protein
VRANGHHGALTELALDAAAAGERRGEAVGLLGHRGFSTNTRAMPTPSSRSKV